MESEFDVSLKEGAGDKPLSILQLDPADGAVLRIADERDAVQKKTFTKWVNKHLKKASRHDWDLFEYLRDGHNLIFLLEELSGEHLPRERGRMRFHMLQNVQIALDFLRFKKIKLVNIRAEDIIDGNPKLTLGLIWTIILHFQISDIVVGQQPNVTAREALLRWAGQSTARYPGVRVLDFTSSWRDGLAFSALLHRNRPDLVDWRTARSYQARERLHQVFHVAEREYGVTRLLDPEDVDTPEPDEKSLITYISSLYNVFPEPPQIHPLYDAEAQRRLAKYRELASSIHTWIREKIAIMQERSFRPTLIEMKKLAADSVKFKNDEIPPRYRDKQRLTHIFPDLQIYFEAVGEVDIEPELHIDVIDKNWNHLIMLHQEREQSFIDEIKRLERLQRLAENVDREMKSTANCLEEFQRCVEDETRRVDRLHPLEAKHAVDLVEQDIRTTEIQIQNIYTDVHTLTEGRYSQALELQKRVQKLHQRWVALRSLLHKRFVQPLSVVSFPVEERVVTTHRTTVHETRLVDTNPHFRNLLDCIDWCKNKLKQLQEADYGSDLPSVQNELDIHQREHKNVDQFHSKLDKCVHAKNSFNGEELSLYSRHLGTLQKLYSDLLTTSNKRLTDLDSLHDFIQSATGELVWLNAKEDVEVTRDWSDKNLNLQSIEQYYESLMSDLEKREIQFSAVQDSGEALALQHHPASKTIQAYMSAMQSQRAWLLQLTLCLEVHLKHATHSQQFFKDVHQIEQWISKRDEEHNSVYSELDFTPDEGERLLKGVQELREELNSYGDQVQRIVDQAKDIVPMKQRRQPVTRPLQVTCICSYKQVNMSIEKNEQCTLYDNSGRVKWRVKNSLGVESPVPGVCFALHPPDKEALDGVDRLRRQYDCSVALWQRKQLRLRQDMIFATIEVVKGWDLPQFLAMGQDQRTAIRKALIEDADKLLTEGDLVGPQLRRLGRVRDDVNRLFDDFEKRARAEEESKNAPRIFNDQVTALQQSLGEAKRLLNTRIAASLPRDLDSLEHLVLEHKDYEKNLKRLAPDVETLQQTFRGITLKTRAVRNKLDNVMSKWNHLWDISKPYIERLKCVEIVLSGLEDNTSAISEFEIKLASYDELPSDDIGLQSTLEVLKILQNSVAQQQLLIDQLNADAQNARRLVEKSRINNRGPHGDMDRLDAKVNRLNARWTNICKQLVDRRRSAETTYGLVEQYRNSDQNAVNSVDESYGNPETTVPVQDKAQELETTKNLLNNALGRAPAIEAINVTGGRPIRKGKNGSRPLPEEDAGPSAGPPADDIEKAIAAELDRFRRDENRYIQKLIDAWEVPARRFKEYVEKRGRKWLCLHPGCGREYSANSTAVDHYRIKHEEARYSCPVCGRPYSYRAGLQEHLQGVRKRCPKLPGVAREELLAQCNRGKK